MNELGALVSPPTRVWYQKKRNILRIALLILCLGELIAAGVKYEGHVRQFLWRGIAGYSAALIFFSYLFTYVVLRFGKRQPFTRKADLLFDIIMIYFSLFPLIMLGRVTVDIVQGPVVKIVHVVEIWDPRRGGDRIRTADGKE
ncbi:hypothetical protein FHS19_001437 [Paenibacillus rhizosphaerae]|uniref:Uncharacterized protein n=1 Tax=Paenibacillus rhizosphaerae TaxID=297318 RepID=A0A839TJU5_9BACL|nr:hypothetical protein [Paenibacillus rhizosphaerae]MBB3126783.1 hypothetical protein [Paenibacillus rhizosphaerae]